jgi:uncharacterized protein (TIRG00374 family)
VIVVRSMGYKITFLQALENVFFNIYFSYVTPMSIGGQPFQIYHLSKIGIPTYDATNIAITRMFVGIMVVFTVDLLLINQVISTLQGTIGLGIVLIGFLVTVGISVAGFMAFTNQKILFGIVKFFGKIIKSEKVKEKEESVVKWIQKMGESTKTLFLKNYWSLVIDWGLGSLASILTPLILKTSIEAVTSVHLPLANMWGILMMLNTLVYYVPTPGSSGGIEGFYQLVFSHIYDTKSAMVGILVYRIVTYYLIIFLGTALIWRFAKIREEVNIAQAEAKK